VTVSATWVIVGKAGMVRKGTCHPVRVLSESVGIGFGLGFFVALQLGPMSLFLIRSTLRSGLAVGLAIGAGIAFVDAVYATLGATGAAALLQFDPLRIVLGLAGAIVLVVLGLRTFLSAFRVRAGLDVADDVASPWRAFLTAVVATASNPSTIVSWAAIFGAASSTTSARPVPLVVGVALGSLTWVSALAVAVAVVRRAAGPRTVALADGVAGLGLTTFGGVLGWRALTRPS
jgi:putative LysE/RhtB family amino acid efflux pump